MIERRIQSVDVTALTEYLTVQPVEWLWQEPLPDMDIVSWEILGWHGNIVRRLAQAIGIEELRCC